MKKLCIFLLSIFVGTGLILYINRDKIKKYEKENGEVDFI